MNDDNKISTLITAIALLVIAISCFICSISDAQVLIFGDNIDNTAITLPDKSYVIQGSNISQGNTYDLSGVYGWSGILGNWKNDYNAGYTTPDNVVDLNNYDMHKVFIDQEIFATGRWYQVDKYTANEYGNAFRNGNNFVFYVAKQHENTSVTNQTITSGLKTETSYINKTVFVSDGNTVIEIPVTIPVELEKNITEKYPVNNPVQMITIIIPTTVQPTSQPPTLKSNSPVVTQHVPIPITIILLSLLVVIISRQF